MMLAMITIGSAQDQLLLIIGVSMYGLSQGASSPTLLAWATDLCDEQHRGRGIAFFYIFMEMGIGLGALFSSFIYANDPAHFSITFAVCATLCVAAFLYLVVKSKSEYAT